MISPPFFAFLFGSLPFIQKVVHLLVDDHTVAEKVLFVLGVCAWDFTVVSAQQQVLRDHHHMMDISERVVGQDRASTTALAPTPSSYAVPRNDTNPAQQVLRARTVVDVWANKETHWKTERAALEVCGR